MGLGWHGRASDSGQAGQICSPFSHRIRTKTYETNKNNTKQKNKAIKSVGCLPRSARLESLALRLESVFKKDQGDHIV